MYYLSSPDCCVDIDGEFVDAEIKYWNKKKKNKNEEIKAYFQAYFGNCKYIFVGDSKKLNSVIQYNKEDFKRNLHQINNSISYLKHILAELYDYFSNDELKDGLYKVKINKPVSEIEHDGFEGVNNNFDIKITNVDKVEGTKEFPVPWN